MADNGPLYLGFDLSTQQLKAVVIQSDLTIVSDAKVDFDGDFGSKYGITKGVLQNPDEGEVFAPVAMWLESLDLVLQRLKENNTPLDRIRGISGSCQQHGSVYWGREAESLLGGLKADKPLVDQLTGAFSHPYAPNWQDHSTQAECDQYDAQLETAERLAQVTGSAAHHRFTGPQIMRLRRKLPEMYAATSRISLVSSFLASVLIGSVAPMDISDACGMNLWDIPGHSWSDPLLELTAGKDGVADLRSKLGSVREDGGGSMGNISSYFTARYGFHPSCGIAPFTGDNPATILALPLRPLDAIVSLGTSTTFLMITPVYKPDPSYHFFNHPTTPGQYMFMLCYKNGGLAREKVRDALPAPAPPARPWATFNHHALATPPLAAASPSDPAKLGLYFYLPEIVPNISAGTWRYTCSAADGSNLQPDATSSPETDARLIIESQALSMRLRSRPLVTTGEETGLPAQPRRIYLVGGGSHNPAITRVMGDVLGGSEGVYTLDVGGNACALGGAYKAVWAMERAEGERFDELIGKRWKEEGAIQRVDEGYKEGVFEKYGNVLGAFEEMEAKILEVARNKLNPHLILNNISTAPISPHPPQSSSTPSDHANDHASEKKRAPPRSRHLQQTLIIIALSYLDCLVFALLLAPQLLWHVGFLATASCALMAVPFLVMLPAAIIRERYWHPKRGGLSPQRATTLFEDLVIRCVRYAFAHIPANIGRVFLSRGVALPFFRFRMLRRGYLAAPVHWREHEEAGFKGVWIARDAAAKPDLVVYYVHGGGFSMGSAFFYLEFLATWLSVLVCEGYSNPAIFALEYTLVPDASYPTQINEAVAGYRHVLKVAGDPSIVCVSGDSAGGMLVLSLLLHIGKKAGGDGDGIEKPAMAMLISPWVTLLSAEEKDSPGYDYLSVGQLNRYGRLLAGDGISATDPLVSPGCCHDAEWWRRASPSKGFFITYGEGEILAPDIDELIRRLDQAGIAVKGDKEAGGIHAWPVASVFLSTSEDERLRGLRTMSSEIRKRMG
ncbi:putative D-xylulose kinase A [Podospora conica]|nr:putative D-xylulose kinase A [Schizothecium conicum]